MQYIYPKLSSVVTTGLLMCLALILLAMPSYAQKKQSASSKLDEIAIVVNNDVITYREWNAALKAAQSELARIPAAQRPSRAVLEGEVLNMLVLSRLQDDLARKNNIVVADQEIDAAINDIAVRNDATVEMLKQYLQQTGQSFTAFRDNIRKQILSARIRDSFIQQKVRLTENDVDLFMLSAEFQAANAQMLKERVQQTNVRHILVRITKDLSEPEAKTRISRLRERIIGGEDFELIARAQSDDPGSAAKGGDLGWVSSGQLTPDFEKSMQSLPLKQLSQPVRTPFGYHLIQVLERREGTPTPDTIRNAAREMLFRKRAMQEWALWQENMLNQTYIEKRFEK